MNVAENAPAAMSNHSQSTVSVHLLPEELPVYIIKKRTVDRARNLMAFWILGFCNNFTYWVLITAAFDILARTETQTLLVAETLPATLVTMCALLLRQVSPDGRVTLLILLCLAAYVTLAFSAHVWLDFAGVAAASLSRGLSDITFLAHAAKYERDVLSTWSSGTGVATFVGPLMYAALTMAGLDPRRTLLTMCVVPLLICISFWGLLTAPGQHQSVEMTNSKPSVQKEFGDEASQDLVVSRWSHHLNGALRRLLVASKYVLPLFVFYIEMYFMNSGLLELIYFGNTWLSHSQQYRWYSTIRCFGQMVSRSGHRWFHTTLLWLPVLGHAVILLVMLMEACLHFLPNIWIMFAMLLLEGLLEGTLFKSTMFNIYSNVDSAERADCLSIMPMAFFPPAVISGFLAIPLHDALCRIV